MRAQRVEAPTPETEIPLTRGPEAVALGATLIVEDHPLYRNALIHLLKPILEDSTIIATASAEAGLQIAASTTDIRLVLLDVTLPGLSGTEAVAAFHRVCSDAALVVLSGSEDRREVLASFRDGACAFVSKLIETDLLVEVVRRARAGKIREPEWIGPTELQQQAIPALTPRQTEILAQLSRGYTNKEIGLRLGLAEITVKQHISGLFRALGATNRTQAVLTARRLGMQA